MYALLMLSKSLKMIQLDGNISDLRQILCKNVILMLVYLLVLLFELKQTIVSIENNWFLGLGFLLA